ncbi:hypothetical protein [Saccharicrinis aurantiacus]|uniref:hypothetical protein n=1 Tax=Saccharicrinis aurantiacus TaxID=1849719 RepID=UPI0008399E28|nr:hypothetical protein [Saccharicrinis aurantiacus]
MMKIIDTYIRKVFLGRKKWGVNIRVDKDGNIHGYAVLLVKEKQKVNISKHIEISSVDVFKDPKFKGVPIYLSIESNLILEREVEEYNENTMADKFHIFDSSNFYIQVATFEAFSHIQLIRKGDLDSVINVLRSFELQLVSVVLGPVNFTSCIDYISDESRKTEYELSQYKIVVDEHETTNISRVEKGLGNSNIIIGDESIENELIIPYGNAFAGFIYENIPDYINLSLLKIGNVDYAYSRFLKYLLPSSLSMLLMVLLGNFLLLQSFSQKQADLQIQYAQYQQLYSKLNKLEEQLKDHTKIFGSNSNIGQQRFTSYADRLGSIVKGRIVMSSLIINPLSIVHSNLTKVTSIGENRIEVSGICESPLLLNAWLQDVLKESFVVSITEQQFITDDYTNVNKFSLVITTRN